MNTVYAPTTETVAETFLWYQAAPRLSLGVAHLWKQNALRFLGSYQLVRETERLPSFSVSVGLQGIGTGNPGYAGTFEKNWTVGEGRLNAFAGVGWRSNENHAHPLGGIKYSPDGRLTFGYQHDGHQGHPFVTYSVGQWIGGVYLIGGRSPALMSGYRF
jgi:hypothetical protein